MVSAVTLVESMFAPLAEQPLRRKARGGWRQQVAAASTEPATKKRKMSDMCIEHIRDWSEGISNGPRIWRHAHAAVNDGNDDPGIGKLHACGNSERDQHIHNNIDKLFREHCGFWQVLDFSSWQYQYMYFTDDFVQPYPPAEQAENWSCLWCGFSTVLDILAAVL